MARFLTFGGGTDIKDQHCTTFKKLAKVVWKVLSYIQLTWFSDALADTFDPVGGVMSLCQLLSILELFHIVDGIEEGWLLPRFVQVRSTLDIYYLPFYN